MYYSLYIIVHKFSTNMEIRKPTQLTPHVASPTIVHNILLDLVDQAKVK